MAVSEVYNEDCMIGMARYPDNYFELAIVDPPYGIDAANVKKYFSRNTKEYDKKDWDKNTPTKEYWEQLFRVSQNQIVCGGNYFIEYLHSSKCWIVWDKMNGTNDMPDCELAWTSFDKKIRKFELHHFGANYDKDRFHPTQKPVALYKWLLKNYAKEGDKILDTHLGSGSSRIACCDGGFDFYGWEIDKDYFDAMEKRFNTHIQQLTLDI